MNRENIQKVRDALKTLDPALFDMDAVGAAGCGTPACIAGWAVRVIDGKSDWGAMRRAADLFEIPTESASGMCDLFSPAAAYEGTGLMRQTPAQAVRVLDYLLETGTVDWSVAGEADDAA